MSEVPASLPPIFCPRCDAYRPETEFKGLGNMIAVAGPGRWFIDLVKHKPCGKMAWRPTERAKERV